MTSVLAAHVAALTRTPQVVDALLRGTPAGEHRADEGPGTWSAFDVLRHLISADATSWMARAETIRAHGSERPFAPPDPLGDPAHLETLTIEQLLDEFARTRGTHLRTVDCWRLSADDLARQGRHPQLGIVTLGQLFATWVVHDLNHVAQIARVLAWQRRDAVGAWRRNLAILDRPLR
jgi:hypothetical protein